MCLFDKINSECYIKVILLLFCNELKAKEKTY